MNRKLRAKIIETFGTQADFSSALKIDEAIISKVVRNRKQLDARTQQEWARYLKCTPKEIFPEN